MKHSWQNMKLETIPQQKATKQLITFLLTGKLPFRIVSPYGTYYIDPNGVHNAGLNIHTGVKVEDRKIYSTDTGELLANRSSKVSVLVYTTKALPIKWRCLK